MPPILAHGMRIERGGGEMRRRVAIGIVVLASIAVPLTHGPSASCKGDCKSQFASDKTDCFDALSNDFGACDDPQGAADDAFTNCLDTETNCEPKFPGQCDITQSCVNKCRAERAATRLF